MDERMVLLRQIQELEFMAIELNLFLDTHPQDKLALRDFYIVRDKLTTLINRYEGIYGPLTILGFTPAKYPWQWIEGPWPWEIEYV